MSSYLGQHFLKNKSAVEKIVAALQLVEGDNVIEIGPGHGELMAELLKHPIKLIAIEKDRELANELRDRFEVIEGDALKELVRVVQQLKTVSYKLVGNIPYYITGHLLRIISELENKPSVTVLTIQKEVAERIVSQPPKMNRLSAITQFWAEPKIITILPPSDFDPPPEVESAVIELRSKKYEVRIMNNYYKMVKILFQQPRKTILNNLSFVLSSSKEEIAEKLKLAGLKIPDRPQDLSVEMIKEITLIFGL